jgi:2',3'-cyclic-nucleotide 3'-phosphodiesterase
MPGSSLWLLPPEDHALNSILTTLIKKTSTHFNSPHLFVPHVTLTAEINPESYSTDPQQWIDTIPFPQGCDVVVRFDRLESEDVFVKKLYIRVQKRGVRDIGKAARQEVKGYGDEQKAAKWADEEYYPHLSLL